MPTLGGQLITDDNGEVLECQSCGGRAGSVSNPAFGGDISDQPCAEVAQLLDLDREMLNPDERSAVLALLFRHRGSEYAVMGNMADTLPNRAGRISPSGFSQQRIR